MLTAEPKEAHPLAEPKADQDRAGPHRWTPETAREAAWLSRESRATRRHRDAPTDSDIERGLREKAVSDPRAAEILLRWLQRLRPVTETPGVDLDALSTPQLETLYAGLVKIAALPDEELRVLVASLLADNECA
jgi:hypothetical protein